MRGVVEDIRAEIDGGGFTVAAIAGDGGGVDWAYTIGLHRNHDHPELFVAGLDAPLAGAVLEVLGARVAAGERLGADPVVELEGGVVFRLHAVDELFRSHGDWFVLGRAVSEAWGARWPDTVQLVWRDETGEYPSAPASDRWMLRQPLLFG